MPMHESILWFCDLHLSLSILLFSQPVGPARRFFGDVPTLLPTIRIRIGPPFECIICILYNIIIHVCGFVLIVDPFCDV